MQHRSVVRLVALLAVAVLAVGCSGDDEPQADTSTDTGAVTTSTEPFDGAEVRTGGELIVGLAGEAATLIPGAGSFSEVGSQIAYTIYDPIAARGADGAIHPFAAESIEPNADATEWTVRLRQGLVFHDGTELTATTMQQIFTEYLSADGAVTAGDLAQVSEFRVDDDLTFTYVLVQANAAFADLLTGPIGWPFSPDACRAAGEDCGEQPVGTGPFEFVSWTRDNELVVERNPDYWRSDASGTQLPYVDVIRFRPLTDQSARLLSVQSGTIDAAGTFLAEYIGQAREADGVETYEWTGNSGGVTLLNTLIPPLDDLRVRRALRMSTDQDDVIGVMGGTGITSAKTQMYGQDSPWYSEDVADAWDPYDVNAAQTLLDEYIDDPTRSDGKAPGAPITLTYQAPADPALQEIAQFYQSVWTGLGIEVDLVSVEQAGLIANVVGSADNTPPFSGAYQVSIFRLGGETDPYTLLSRALGDPATQPVNFANYSSPAIAAHVETLRTSTDFDVRYEAVEEIMFELAEQVPWLWQGSVVSALYATPQVRNIAGWTIPGPDGGEDIPGAGVANGQTHWSHVWKDAG